MKKQEVLDTLLPVAMSLKFNHGLLPSLTASQVIHESGWLKHVVCNNCLGIKCVGDHSNCCKTVTQEWVGDHYEAYELWFQAFESIQDCIEKGYVTVLMLPRYEETRACENFYTATNQVRLDGYATGPKYHLSLRDIILQNKLYEWDFDVDPEENLTDNFKWKESFSSVIHRRYKYLPINYTWKRVIQPPEYLKKGVEDAAKNMQLVRSTVQKPLKVNSWYRTPEYNASLAGSSPTSYHLKGEAIDVVIPGGWTGMKLVELAYDITEFRGFGIGKTYVHMDLRDKYTIWWY